jgi:hypothetical protein
VVKVMRHPLYPQERISVPFTSRQEPQEQFGIFWRRENASPTPEFEKTRDHPFCNWILHYTGSYIE